jgi:hypothetical protein
MLWRCFSLKSVQEQWQNNVLQISRRPTLVNDLGAVLLTLLEDHLVLVLRNVDSVDVTAGLYAETGARFPGWDTVDFGNIDEVACVELEGRLGGGDFKMNLAFRVVERSDLLQRLRASVNRDALRIGIDDEAVVDLWLLFTQVELGLWTDAGVLLDRPCRSGILVHDLVLVGDQGNISTRN